MFIQLRCPQCGAIIDYDDSRDFMYCQYCGAKVTNNPNPNSAGGTLQPGVNANQGNLTIDYSTTRPEYPLSVVINGERWNFPNNSSMAFSLPPGVHNVLFYVARRGWRRTIMIPQYGNPVRVHVVYAGRVKIFIN